MLRPANVVDLPILRALVREGALTGSFDRSLGDRVARVHALLQQSRQALASGYFVEPDPRTGDLATMAVLAFVYLPDEDPTMHRPIGFGLFKAASIGYELWLTGIDAAGAGRGHGRRMLAELLARAGSRAYLVRVQTYGKESPAMAHLLGAFGYSCIRETPRLTLYLRSDAPESLRARSHRPPPHRRQRLTASQRLGSPSPRVRPDGALGPPWYRCAIANSHPADPHG
jgi:GNAT superfamily N-acetyltransferase